jgi:tRNA nucleotidyltransferase (CCA-adding enzyme)
MDIIITHRNADFDALASQIAASLLYPEAVKVAAGGTPPIVRKFLTLHKDHFDLTPAKKIDMGRVTRMIVVDVRSRSRLKDYAALLKRIDNDDPDLQVHIYDHHQSADDDLLGHEVHVEPVGSATTLLVEQLIERNLHVTPIEATALALGIYADTGSLTYASTTVRDSEATTFLLKHGASMITLRYYLHSPLNGPQRKILAEILTTSKAIELCGVRIGISTVPLKKMIPGMSELVNEALMLEGNDATFVFFPSGQNVTIIGRTWVQAVDVGAVMEKLGGGGHHGAGAATIKNTNIKRAKARFMAVLQSNPPKPYLVRYLMSSPVCVLTPNQTVDEVLRSFQGENISGAPVVKDGKMIGLVSKRDLASATQNGRSHLPISSCMAHEVKTIEPSKSLTRALEKMSTDDIGRLPVMENGNLIGIVTRNDIVNVIYNGEYHPDYKTNK